MVSAIFTVTKLRHKHKSQLFNGYVFCQIFWVSWLLFSIFDAPLIIIPGPPVFVFDIISGPGMSLLLAQVAVYDVNTC